MVSVLIRHTDQLSCGNLWRQTELRAAELSRLSSPIGGATTRTFQGPSLNRVWLCGTETGACNTNGSMARAQRSTVSFARSISLRSQQTRLTWEKSHSATRIATMVYNRKNLSIRNCMLRAQTVRKSLISRRYLARRRLSCWNNCLVLPCGGHVA